MEIDSRRKPTYDLLEQLVNNLIRVRWEAIADFIKVFPEVVDFLVAEHRKYEKHLQEMLVRSQSPEDGRDDQEPLYFFLRTLAFDAESSGVDVEAFDAIMLRLGLPISVRD